jgi:hypothetical protein
VRMGIWKRRRAAAAASLATGVASLPSRIYGVAALVPIPRP